MMNPSEFDNIAAVEHDFWWYRGGRRALSRVIQPFLRGRTIRKVLDAGCGTGYFARQLEREYGWQAYALDLACEGLTYARNLGLTRLSQADMRALPFPDAAFDAVVALDVLVHFDPGAEGGAIGELTRVLSPGGLLILRAAAFDALRSRHSQFVQERQRYTRGRLSRTTRESGVRVLRCTYFNGLLLPLALAKFRLWEPLLGKPPESGVKRLPQWLDRVLYGCLWAESEWLGGGMNLPAGQSLILIGEKVA